MTGFMGERTGMERWRPHGVKEKSALVVSPGKAGLGSNDCSIYFQGSNLYIKPFWSQLQSQPQRQCIITILHVYYRHDHSYACSELLRQREKS